MATMETDTALRCDVCGGPCDGTDAVTDRAGTVVLCGAVYGNGCDRFLAAVDSGEDVADVAGFTYRDITVEWHRTDGFTLSVLAGGLFRHRRFIGYTVEEATALFVAELAGSR